MKRNGLVVGKKYKHPVFGEIIFKYLTKYKNAVFEGIDVFEGVELASSITICKEDIHRVEEI